MRRRNRKNSVKMSRRIFLNLFGISMLTLISLGFFWIESRLSAYHKEIQLLKKTYSETKKLEIKNKILQIKDYIEWIQYISLNPLTNTLKHQINQLTLPLINAGEDNARLSNSMQKSLNDSICKSKVPVYILNTKGEIMCSYNPFSETGSTDLGKEELDLLKQIKKNNSTGEGTLPLYTHQDAADSILTIAAYFNNRILPGFKVVSFVRSKYFISVLQVHILDSVSRLRYSENEYVFINTIEGKALITHGKYNKKPIDILKSGNTAWLDIFKVQQSSANNTEGIFHTYSWLKPSTLTNSSKTSYFSYIPSWKWIIGTGFYEDDINSVIELRKKELHHDMQKAIFNILLYLLISIALCYFLVWFFSKHLGKNIELFKIFFERAAKENIMIDKSQVNYHEFKFMAEAGNLMVENRKLIEKSLMESESHYRFLFEQNPVPMLIYELDSLKMLAVNDAFINHYGYTKDEILSMLLTDLYPENEKKAISDLTKKLIGLAYVGEWHHLKKDGTLMTIEARSHGFSFEGRASRIAVINDISRRIQIEQALQKSEEFYRAIFENTGTSAVLIEENTYISLANAEFEKLSKYSKQEIEGKKSWKEFVFEEDIERMKVQHDLRREKQERALRQYEFKFTNRDGDIRNIILTIDLIPGTKKSIASLLDITERKLSEIHLRKLNRIYALLSEINQAIMQVHEPKALFEIACNIAVEQGGFLMAWIGILDKATKRVDPIAHSGNSDDYLERLNITLDDSERSRGPTANALRHGEHAVVNNIAESQQMLPWREDALSLGYRASAAFPLSVFGELRGTLNLYAAEANFFDDEELKLLDKLAANISFAMEYAEEEEQRRKAEQAIQILNKELEQRVIQRTAQFEASNKELESFSYSISHDLRAPLRAIFGFSQILSRRHKASLNAEGQEYMGYIVEASVRMEQLINDLLEYSRLGRKSLDLYPVSLQTIVDNIYSDFNQQIHEIDAKFIIDKALPQIIGDETLLRQIFTNLIGNALTYRRPDIQLIIRISCEMVDHHYLIKVTDNGIGISKEYWEKIFNVFQRLHSEDQYPGTGIGLANVKKSVSLLAGKVWVESFPGKGSTFFIKIPQHKIGF
jgi:PAS domain S-box-containing protein